MDIELIHFLYSPYNEKARWGLDFKGVAHLQRSLLPGPHMPVVKRLTGQTGTPVVRFGDSYVHGSDRILEELERRFPDPPLFPADAEVRREAVEIEARIDDDWGPRVRCAVLAGVIPDARYVARMFGHDKPAWLQACYGATFPFARGLIRKGNAITGPDSISDGYEAAEAALDFVAEKTRATGFLVGDAFSVADLSVAWMLAPLCNPPDSSMARPQPYPEGLAKLLDHFHDHPSVRWILDLYATHRYRKAAA